MLTDLAVTPIAETLRRLAAGHLSGDLQIRSGKVAKTVFFDRGRVVFAASNLKKDRLGEALVALGRITGEEFQRAEDIVKADRSRRFGEALVEAGVLEENEIGRSVARQVNRIVLSLFRFDEGASVFEERPCPIPLEYMVSLSLHRILHEGIRAMKSEALVRKGLGDLERTVVLADVPPFRFDLAACPVAELEILEAAQEPTSLRFLGLRQGSLDFERLRTVYALLASGVLVEGEARTGPPVVHMETGTFLLSALRNTPPLSTPEAVLLEVRNELLRSSRLDRQAWLEVSAEAPREELVRALEEKMERYHLLLDTAGEDQHLQRDVEIILGRAWTLMRALRPEEGEAEEPQGEAEEPATPPVPVGGPEPRPAPPVAHPAPSPVPPSRGPDHRVVEGEARLTVGDFASAVRVFRELVESEPDNAAHRSRLAVAMASWPPTAQEAEREFLEAVRLQPDDPDLHFRLGLYYKAMKQRSRAVAQFQTAVRLSPRHALARHELQGLAPRDAALTTLKRLFRRSTD